MKISKILPQTPRLSKMDIEFAPAARPGAPTFGRSQGMVTGHDRISISSEGRDLVSHFKNTAQVLPLNISDVDFNVETDLFKDDLTADQGEVIEVIV